VSDPRSADPADPAGPATDGDVVAPRPPEAARAATPRLPLDLAGTYAVGFAMGSADLVPGFSGGTVALVAGIYHRLIANVRQGARTLSLALRGQLRDAGHAFGAIEWTFVVALLAGVGSAIVALASFLERQLQEQPVAMSAVFLGLVVGASIVAVGELRLPAPIHLLVGGVVAVITFLGLGLRSGSLSDPSLLLFFSAGAIAICAMILPGVSGSFLLLLLGMYEHVIGAVTSRDLVVLAVFAVGCVSGLAGFSTLLNWLLQRYHDLVLAALIGLMAGSSRVLWPWPSGVDGVGDTRLGAPVAAEVPLAGGLALIAVVAVVTVAWAARRIARAT
jgi:putative membrane protein